MILSISPQRVCKIFFLPQCIIDNIINKDTNTDANDMSFLS
jgi:hypothetical protein